MKIVLVLVLSLLFSLTPAAAKSDTSQLQVRCGKNIMMATYVEKDVVVLPAHTVKGEASCTIEKDGKRLKIKPQKTNFLLTPFLSIDMAFLKIEKMGKPVKLFSVGPSVGTAATILRPQAVFTGGRTVAAPLEDCKEAARGSERIASLPKEESETHPDQTYGYAFWDLFCKAQLANKAEQKKHVEKIVQTKIVWADERNFLIDAALSKDWDGAMVTDSATGNFIGFLTASIGFRNKELALTAENHLVGRVVSTKTDKLFRDAVKLGLWDY